MSVIGALAVAGLYFLLPELYNDYLADVTGIRASTHPRVIELRAEIPPLLNSDTAMIGRRLSTYLRRVLNLSRTTKCFWVLGAPLYARVYSL